MAALAVAATALLVSACAESDGDDATTAEPASVPSSVAVTQGTASTIAPATASVAPTTPACTDLSADEVTTLVGAPGEENWTGDGAFTAATAQRAPVEGDNAFFTHVIYLTGQAPGLDGQVFVFASGSEDLTDPTGLLVGADAVTREFWVWGAEAAPGSPAAEAASAAVAAAPVCTEG